MTETDPDRRTVGAADDPVVCPHMPLPGGASLVQRLDDLIARLEQDPCLADQCGLLREFSMLLDVNARVEAQRAHDALAQVARINAVGILASSLVHELAQPLSAASFFSSAAIDLMQPCRDSTPHLHEILGRIDAQIRRTDQILGRLRGFLRGREMIKVAVSLEQLVGRAVDLVQWFALDSDVKIQVRLTTVHPLPQVWADPVQIEQVMINLLCNSIQAITASGSARREILIDVSAGLDEIQLGVSDTGPGLPPGRHEELFDIFQSTNDVGLGMGLAISRAIVEAHGGRLWADPHPPEGAAFHFTLPCAKVQTELRTECGGVSRGEAS